MQAHCRNQPKVPSGRLHHRAGLEDLPTFSRFPGLRPEARALPASRKLAGAASAAAFLEHPFRLTSMSLLNRNEQLPGAFGPARAPPVTQQASRPGHCLPRVAQYTSGVALEMEKAPLYQPENRWSVARPLAACQEKNADPFKMPVTSRESPETNPAASRKRTPAQSRKCGPAQTRTRPHCGFLSASRKVISLPAGTKAPSHT